MTESNTQSDRLSDDELAQLEAHCANTGRALRELRAYREADAARTAPRALQVGDRVKCVKGVSFRGQVGTVQSARPGDIRVRLDNTDSGTVCGTPSCFEYIPPISDLISHKSVETTANGTTLTSYHLTEKGKAATTVHDRVPDCASSECEIRNKCTGSAKCMRELLATRPLAVGDRVKVANPGPTGMSRYLRFGAPLTVVGCISEVDENKWCRVRFDNNVTMWFSPAELERVS